jgi:hypothetical protein
MVVRSAANSAAAAVTRTAWGGFEVPGAADAAETAPPRMSHVPGVVDAQESRAQIRGRNGFGGYRCRVGRHRFGALVD